VACNVRATLHAPAAPGALNGVIELENDPGETLQLEGRYDHRSATAEMSLDLKSTRWPLAIARAGVVGKGKLDGTIHLSHAAGRWATSGEATLHDVDATGDALSGDRVVLTRVVSGWDAAIDEAAWSVDRFVLKSHVGSISGRRSPKANGAGSSLVLGRVDLAALAKLLPHTLRLRPGVVIEKGLADLRAEIVDRAGAQEIDVRVGLPELLAHDAERSIALEEESTLSAHVVRSADGVQVDRVRCRTGFCDLAASGDMENGISLKGMLDLGVMRKKLGAMVDFGAIELAGRAEISGTYKKHAEFYNGGLKADVSDLVIAGATAEPIVQKTIRLVVNAEGASDAAGLPVARTNADLTFRGTDVALTTNAERKGESIELMADVAARFAREDREGRAVSHIHGRLQAQNLFEFDDFQLRLRPADPKSRGAEVLIAARGRFDASAGSLALDPIAGAGPGVIAPVAEGLRVSGLNGGEFKVAGGVTADMARVDRAIAYWTAGMPQGVGGRLIVGVDAGRDASGLIRYDVRLDSPDILLPGATATEGPLAIASRGEYQTSTNVLKFAQLNLQSHYGSLAAAGSLRDPGGASVIDARGTLRPNWKLVDAMLVSSIEPNARVTAEARPFRVQGPLGGGSLAAILRKMEAEFGVNLASASAFGVNVGPAALVVRCAKGQVTIDPIETTINQGKLVFRPIVALDDAGNLAILLDSSSAITGATIDDEVSTRVLSYAAPVLHEAAQARGQVSVGIDRAEIPFIDGSGKAVDLSGNITFNQVTFGPGPVVQQVLGALGRQNPPQLRLDQTVPFWVSHGQVGQKGLTVIVNPKVQIVFDGAVGFDKTIALSAGVPLNASMLGNNAMVNEIVDGTRVTLPMRGTLSHPSLDRRALEVALREAGRSMVKRGVQAEARQLLNRVPGIQPGGARASGGSRGLANDALDLLLPSTRRPPAPPR
jgi:translocation and assembly module TamB